MASYKHTFKRTKRKDCTFEKYFNKCKQFKHLSKTDDFNGFNFQKKKKKSTELKNIEAVAGLPAYFLVAEVPTTPIGFLLALSKRNCKASVKQCTYKQRNCHKLN